jgi:hypothetical protein
MRKGRKLIDIGFVLNRAAVFAILSAIVIGTFVVVEWAASEWLVNVSHTTGFVAGMIVALVIGLSLRYVHAFVDRSVDRLFFRKRHEDEATLGNFAREASYMTDTTLLLERAVREVSEHTDANSAAILVRKGAGYAPGGVHKRRAVQPGTGPLESLQSTQNVILEELRALPAKITGNVSVPAGGARNADPVS